jgi:DNA-dependent protein kinase catalytic subunit
MQNPFHNLYVHIFPVLLRLSVHVEKVTRDLFRPLVMQLIHWLTKNSVAENPETMSILQAVFDAVSCPDGSVRLTFLYFFALR